MKSILKTAVIGSLRCIESVADRIMLSDDESSAETSEAYLALRNQLADLTAKAEEW